MKRFLLLTAAVVALGSTGCNSCNPCREPLINWNWFRGDSCGSNGCGYATNGCDTCSQGPAPCSATVPYAGAVRGEQWVAPRGANYGEAELVPPGPMNIVPRG